MQKQSSNKHNPKHIAAIVIVIIVGIAAISVAANSFLTQPIQHQDQPTSANLTLIGRNGQQQTLSTQEILSLQPYSALGGFRKSGGAIAGVGNYTGIIVTDLLDLVGGIFSGDTLTVSASDGYTMTYTYNQVVNGLDFSTFDSTTGSQVTSTKPLHLVLTYQIDGQQLMADEGPFRISVLGDEGLLTLGNLWVKMVTQLQVTHGSPESTSTHTAQPTTTVTATPIPTPVQSTQPTAQPTNAPMPDFNLTVFASNGTKIVIDSEDLTEFVSITYSGGSKRSNGEIVNVGVYTGVKLFDICQTMGFTSNNIVTVKASDGYTTTYSYDQVANGSGFSTYDVNGTSVVASHPLYLIVAYEFEGANLDSYSGPLKIMVVGQDGLITSGNLAARMVVEVDIS